MKRSYVMAFVLAAAAVAWIASGRLTGGDGQPEARKPPAELNGEATLTLVRVRSQQAELRQAEVILQGRSEARRSVEIKTQIDGRVVALSVDQGDTVEAGQVVARLAEDDRPAKLKEAEALREQRRIEVEAADRLAKKGFRSETQRAGATAAYEAAEAAVERARVELAYTEIRAPFGGLIEERQAEIGAFLKKGERIARMVDLNPILIVAEVGERDVGRLEIGITAEARLVTGDEVSGTLHFVGSVADPATRTFRVEVEVANPDLRIPDGATAELRLPLERVLAHRISPAVLTLTDEGVVGVKTLEADRTVGFRPVRILESTAEGIWITGLPERVTLITVGQEFVKVGQPVRAVEEGKLDAPVPGEAAS